MVVMVIGQDISLWDCQSECILQKFSIPVGSDMCATCVWATVESGVLFAVLGFKPTDEVDPDKLISPCVLLALNPATGKSAILHHYKIPGTSEDSDTWFVDGTVAKHNLAVKTSDGQLVIWDVHSAHAVTKTRSSGRFCWTLTQQGSLVVSQEGSACIHQYQLTSD
ncbi:uncharacterized protein [Amphiura filiformis]|uniref:uncharacterized protein n=1 Tax=Amphiura filiformis TaxID=82378 RepID=UPI003B20FFD3